jgi:hypothetical protein
MGGIRNQSEYLQLSEGPCLRGQSGAKMPVLRYFLYVGGALLALLLVFNAVLPQAPATNSLISGAETPTIRIHSDQKWPEPVVFDTSQPTMAPAPVTVAKVDAPAPAVTEAPVNPAVTLASPKARVREAFAQLPLSEQIPPVAPEAKKPEVKPQPRHKVARARPMREPQQPMMMQQPTMRVAQQPHFGLFGNTW